MQPEIKQMGLYSYKQFTIIRFHKTLFTAEGYDVISRQKNLSASVLSAVDLKLKEFGIMKELK